MRSLFFILLLLSCTSKITVIPKAELLALAQVGWPSAYFVIPEKIDLGIRCTDYGEGCKGAHKLRVKGVDMIVVEYETIKQAEKEAKRRNEFVVMNWLLDDVRGEPVLEAFVEKFMKYDPKNPPKLHTLDKPRVEEKK